MSFTNKEKISTLNAESYIQKFVIENYTPNLEISQDYKYHILTRYSDQDSKILCEKIFSQNEKILNSIIHNYKNLTDEVTL